jgi:proline iminopeptidase
MRTHSTKKTHKRSLTHYKKNTKTSRKRLHKTNKNKTQRKLRDAYAHTQLYPLIEPNYKQMITVSKLHTIYIETYGNPKGKPVLYVHGGPGAGINQNMARFFNPQKYFIVLVDQRGSGKSTPTGEMHNNTTKHLISDFEKVRNHLEIDKWMVYGGSWGSTLSLAYAIHHPERTTDLIIRGVYFCTDQENHWVSEPNGAQRFNPEAWKYYKNALPKGHIPKKKMFVDEYAKCFKTATKLDKDKCLLAWGVWEESISTLNPTPLNDIIKDIKKSKYQQMSVIENAYFKNNCFLPKGFFTNKKNLNKLKHIPITIVQGLYDLVTPFVTAYSLHKSLPNSKFFPTIAGHSAMETENIKYLVKATDLA